MGDLKKCRFLSIDASFSNVGVAIGYLLSDGTIDVKEIYLCTTEKSSVKTVRASSDTIRRCKESYTFLHKLLADWEPNVVFAETPIGSQSANAMKSYGVTCMLLASTTPPAIEVSPTEVKIAATGKKAASKREMIDWATTRYPKVSWDVYRNKITNKNEHPADAIAVAHAGVQTSEYERLKEFILK